MTSFLCNVLDLSVSGLHDKQIPKLKTNHILGNNQLVGNAWYAKINEKVTQEWKQGKRVILGRTQASEAVVQRCSVKRLFLKFLQNSQDNTCLQVYSLIKLQTWGLQKTFFVEDFRELLLKDTLTLKEHIAYIAKSA